MIEDLSGKKYVKTKTQEPEIFDEEVKSLVTACRIVTNRKAIRKESCSRSYCQAVGFLVIKDDSISERPG